MKQDVYFENNESAQRVLEALREQIKEFGYVTITSYFKLAGVSQVSFGRESEKKGWTDLNDAKVLCVGNKYTIDFPPYSMMRVDVIPDTVRIHHLWVQMTPERLWNDTDLIRLRIKMKVNGKEMHIERVVHQNDLQSMFEQYWEMLGLDIGDALKREFEKEKCDDR